MKRRVFIKKENKTYYLCNYSLNDNHDGSFYISFPRNGFSSERSTYQFDIKQKKFVYSHIAKQTVRKGVNISYHSTGMIRYHDLYIEKLYSEPIFEISKTFNFFTLSIPRIEKLDLDTPKNDDSVIEIPFVANKRLNFYLSMNPYNVLFPDKYIGFNILYSGLFNLFFVLSDNDLNIPKELIDHFIYLTPNRGLLHNAKYSNEIAYQLFQQKINKTQGMILYPPNMEGEWQIIYSVPKARKPDVKIKFKDRSLKVEEIKKTKTYIKFKVIDEKGRIVKKYSHIISIEIDAEL